MTDDSMSPERPPQATAADIRTRVHRLLVDEFELAEADLVSKANLYTDLGMDSLDSVDLVVGLKEEFGFAVDRMKDEERIRAVRTLDDLYAFVDLKIRGEGERMATSD
jgi:acyl carrier protein